MALEELSLSSRIGAAPAEDAPVDDGGNTNGNKAPRLPRWTRQEILVLIQGKRVADNRIRKDRTAGGLAYESAQPEPKWAFVSSYCRRHGVDRGPVQCRKRWTNLSGDFKKIKEWESRITQDSESFWVMRSDLRRERKLPGFFDREVYDILQGTATPPPLFPGLPLATLTDPTITPDEVDVKKEGGDEVPAPPVETLFDSGRSTVPEDGLFSGFEQSGQRGVNKEMLEKDKNVSTGIPAPIPISEKQYQPFTGGVAGQGTNEKQPGSNPEIGSSHQGKKRKRSATEVDAETIDLQDHLVEVLERNGRILGAHLEAQNTNLILEREARKDYANSLISVLDKLAGALGRIADKL